MAPTLSIREVFMDCQGGMHSHSRLIKNLCKVYQKMPFEEFWETFLYHVKFNLIIFKREPAVERTIDFVAKFATSLCVEKKTQKLEGRELAESSDEEDEEMHPFLLKLFTFLLKHHNANDKAVRFRCCQLVNKLLVSLGDDAQIDDDLYDKVYECMLQRLRDKYPVVRIQAILALTRLQDPQTKECPIISAYLFLLGCDPNPDVRRAVLTCIAATTKTLPSILERTRDTKDLNRKFAYQVLAEKIHIRALTIAQRVSLLKQGLNDRCEAVRDACVLKLLQAWLTSYQGNLLDLLKCLDVENALDVSDQMMKALFQKFPIKELQENFVLLNEELTIPIESLECESVLYWRSLCAFIKSAGVEAEPHLELLLPTGTMLAKYIHTVSEHMKAEENLEAQLKNEFILQQLLELASLLDFSDEVGRRHVDSMLRGLLLSEHISHTLVKPIMAVFRQLHSDLDLRCSALVEIISDIRQPITIVETAKSEQETRQRNLKIAKIRVELNQLRENLDGYIQGQDFIKAAEIKAKVTELEAEKQKEMEMNTVTSSQEVRLEKNDPVTLLKCLTITSLILEDPDLRSLSATLHTLLEVLILPGITNQEPSVRNAALLSLGLCCLLDKDLAKSHLLLFMQVAQIDQEGVKVSALKIIFDLLHTFGLEAFEVDAINEDQSQAESRDDDSPFGNDEEDDDDDILNLSQSAMPPEKPEKSHTAASVLNILVTLLDSESSEVRTIAAEGLAKLMLSGRLVSAKVMSRLLLLWYNPVTGDDAHLRHCLGAFFPIFAFAGRANQAVLEEAFLPTLRTLFNAPATSPLAEVNVGNVAELLAQLTCSRHLINNNVPDDIEDVQAHDNLVVRLCNEILSDPNSFNVRALCKVLNLLEVSTHKVSLLKDIKVLSSRMLKEVRDKACSKMLEKFHRVMSDKLKMALAAEGVPMEDGAGDMSSIEEQINDTQAKLSMMEVDSQADEDAPELLPDGVGDVTGINRILSKRSKARNKSSRALSTNSKRGKVMDESNCSSVVDSVFLSPSPPRPQTSKAPAQPETNDTIVTDEEMTEQEIELETESKQPSPEAPVRRSARELSPEAPIRRSARKAAKNSSFAHDSPLRQSARKINDSPAQDLKGSSSRRSTRAKKDTVQDPRLKLQDYLSDSDEASDKEPPKKQTRLKPRGQGRRTPLTDIENQ